jgi:hypothetical protein
VAAAAGDQILTPRLHHLRLAGAAPEWSDFPRDAEAARLELHFAAKVNNGEWTLRLRQQDVRQTWKVRLNDKDLGRLVADENDTVIYLPVPAGALRAEGNTLTIEQVGTIVDDIRIGEIALIDRPVRDVLSEATVEITVLGDDRRPMPCRLTIVNDRGALATVGASSDDHLAVRSGVVYTADGRANFGLPAGDYTIHAGRGFAYGIASTRFTLRAGETVRKILTLKREVPTPGYVACDTHIHTLTHSGHGDSTLNERVITLAGEGIELAIATEHNLQVDYSAAAEKLGLRRYFTPLVGNEVTTAVGHFNVFPTPAGGPVPDFKLKDWPSLAASIAHTTAAKVVILNHPRDLHSGFCAFGPRRHVALTGDDLDGWPLPANAIEIINSGAQQSDVMRPVHDWLALLNRGLDVTPVGASDSHDVSRYIVGQARTYVRAKDDNPGAIDVAEAIESFRRGRVLVSCGLLVEMTVNGKFGPGDLAPQADEYRVAVRVLGPSWSTADHVELYANGLKLREEQIDDRGTAGVKWSKTWTLPRPRHDVYLVAVASGPPVRGLFWPIARPYQPTAPVESRRVLAVTGAIWLDADGDGRKSSARIYAERLLAAAGKDATKFIASLADYDEAIALQAASMLQQSGISPRDPMIRSAAANAGPRVDRAFRAFADAWRESELARGSLK